MRQSQVSQIITVLVLLCALTVFVIISATWLARCRMVGTGGPAPETAPQEKSVQDGSPGANTEASSRIRDKMARLGAAAYSPAPGTPAQTVAPSGSANVSGAPEEASAGMTERRDPEAPGEEAGPDDQASRAEDASGEQAFMRETFEERKGQFLAIVDAYLSLPIEERPDYVKKAFSDLQRTIGAERQAYGLPARPRQKDGDMGYFLQLLGESGTDEEKVKVRSFFEDMMRMRMGRVQAQLDERLQAGPRGDDPDDPTP